MAHASPDISWLARAQESVALAQSATETQRQYADYEDAKLAFADLNKSLQASVEAASVLRDLGWAGRSISPEERRHLDRLIAKPDSRLLVSVPRELTRFNDEVRRLLLDTWRSYATDQLGDVEGLMALMDTLAEIDGISELAETLRSSLGRLAQAQDKLPSAESLLLVTAVQQSLVALQDSLQPESVRRFLSGVARGGAAVTELTKEVASWLATHNATRSFRIVAGPPAGGAGG